MPSELVESIWGDVALPDTRLRSRPQDRSQDRDDDRAPRRARLYTRLASSWSARIVFGTMLARNPRALSNRCSLISRPALACWRRLSHRRPRHDGDRPHGALSDRGRGAAALLHACGHLSRTGRQPDPTTRRPLAAIACNVWTRSMETRKATPPPRPSRSARASSGSARSRPAPRSSRGRPSMPCSRNVFDRRATRMTTSSHALDKARRIITRAQQEHSIAEGPGTLREFFSRRKAPGSANRSARARCRPRRARRR